MANLLALLSAATWGVADYVGGVTTRRASAVAVVLWSQLIGLGVAFGASPVLGGTLDRASIAWSVAAGLGGASGLVALYSGFASGRMAVVAPTASVVSAAIPVTVGVLVGERPSAAAGVGIALAIPALWMVSRAEAPSSSSGSWSSGLGLGAAAGIGFGLFLVCLGQVPESTGLWPLVPARAASVALMAGVISITGTPGRVPSSILPGVFVAGVGDIAANMLFLSAAQRGLLSTVSVLSSLYPAVTVGLARLLGEPVRRIQWLGVGLSLVAVALITV